jgi:hypothetical protein
VSDFNFNDNIGSQFGPNSTMYLNLSPDRQAWLDKMVRASCAELDDRAAQADFQGGAGQIALAREMFGELCYIHWRRGPADVDRYLSALERSASWAARESPQQARELYLQAHEAYAQAYGRADENTLAVLEGKAHTCGLVGDWCTAHASYSELFDHFHRAKGLMDRETLRVFELMAYCAGFVMGSEQARDIFAGLVEQLHRYGPAHPAVGWAQQKLAAWQHQVKQDRSWVSADRRLSPYNRKRWKDGLI